MLLSSGIIIPTARVYNESQYRTIDKLKPWLLPEFQCFTLFSLSNFTIMLKNFCTICTFLLLQIILIHTGFTQSTHTISGSVLDKNQKGIDLALISLMKSSADSTYVKTEYSDQDGSFQMKELSSGEYILQVNLLGYEEYKQAISLREGQSSQSLPPIVLMEAQNLLDEVVISGKPPAIERKLDRTIVNMDAMISGTGGDILEALERAPGITVENDGTILLKGRGGVTVYINDKPTYLSGTDLESYLRSLPAGSVKQIEIITNPPAKYEAAGNSGIINIIMKRNTLAGFNGNVSVNYRQAIYNGSNNSLNLSYNKNKLSVSASIFGGFYESFQDLNINRYYRNEASERLSSFAQNSFGFRSGKYLNSSLAVDYYLTDNTSLGASMRLNTSPSERHNENTSLVRDAENILTQRVLADNRTESTFDNQLYNLYFNHKLDSVGSVISMDADYVSYKSGATQLFKNFLFDGNNQLNFEDQINGDLPSGIEIYTAKSDFTKIINKDSRFEAGYKFAFTNTDNEAAYSTTVDDVTIPDYDLSNRFLYKEWINAGYLNYTKSFGKLDFQLGLRLETTTLNGDQLGNIEKPASSFTRTYTNLFPTFYTSWKMDTSAHHVMIFSYGRRIDRPYFQDLNPFISPLDKFTFYSGNPDLLPTFSHNLSLSHSFKSIFTTSLNYSKTLDGINETLEIRDGIYYSRPGNISDAQTLSLSFELNLELTKWYSINSYASYMYRSFESQLYTERLESSGTNYNINLSNNFTLGKGWSADLVGSYNSDFIYAQLYIKGNGVLNAGVQKRLLNNAATIRLTVSDILYTRIGDGVINNLRLTDADWNSKFDSRAATLSFSWRFGNSGQKKQRHNSNGSSEEQNRVKS